MLRLPFSSSLPILLLAATAAAQDAGSTFGHARARELAELGRLPAARDVVVRDLVNYHRHRLPLPNAQQDVAFDVRFDRSAGLPPGEVWLQVGYTTAPQGDRALARPCAVALVVDVSGSMNDAGKITAVQDGLRAFVDRLRADDEVALITFSTEAQVVERRRRRGDGRWLLDAIDRLTPGGNTNLHAGLMAGLRELATRDAAERDRRVVLLTDGIANTGVTEPERIVADALRSAEDTIDVSTIGVGENLDVALLQRLADGCRGLFHCVADATDVQKVFVQEADALLAPVARRVRLRIDLPEELAVVRVFHEGADVRDGRVELALPDLNAGATGVVILRCRAAGAADRLAVRAELSFTDADQNQRRQEHAEATLDAGADTWVVRKGDSLERIARSLPGRPTTDEVLAANPGLEAERLRVGQRIRLPHRTAPDLEVRKNSAIAVLAQGLAEMAAACDARRWADADRALRLASDDAQRLFPGQDDDVQRVREIVDGHARTLRRYVDRFRDH